MASIVMKKSVPEEVGIYDSITKSLVINTNLKIYEGYSFTKDVKRRLNYYLLYIR